MKALVTGANGFLGGAIARALLARGDQVKSLARSDSPVIRALGVETIRGDIGDAKTVRDAAEGCDVVFHVAAKAGVWGPANEYFQTNVVGTENVIEACRTHGITRLVHTSSPSVVFAGGDLRGVDESVPYPTKFLAEYPRTKAMAERAVMAANDAKLATVALRPHLIWGPGDQHLVPRIVARARAGKLRKVGSGAYAVDSTYIDNAADAHIAAADSLAPGAPHAGKAYFISNGEPLDVGVLIDRIVGAAGLPPVTRSVPVKVAYVAGWLSEIVFGAFRIEREPLMTRFVAEQLSTAHYFDIGGAKRDFGWSPKISIDEGMRRLGAWLAANPGV
jgi:nucleoside-diphosphate-sugar epimerase